jgi:CubicO group peptidase (beta-lactamase class C family)
MSEMSEQPSRIRQLVVLALALVKLSAGAGYAGASCLPPAVLNDGWATASLEEAALDPSIICRISDKMNRETAANLHGVVIVRKAKLVYEAYRDGADERWGRPVGQVQHGPETLHDARSISKSVVALLFGIAQDGGLIDTRNRIASFFPAPGKEQLLLRDLLTMTSGIAWDERIPYSNPANSERRMIVSGDPYQFVLEQPMRSTPGAIWNYNGGGVQLVAGALQKATRKTLDDFARVALFEPLGIREFEWLPMPASGEVAAASGLRLTPRSMAKLGQLVLEGGRWNGRRIVSQAWIDEMIRPQVTNFDDIQSIGYGYLWWTDHDDGSGRPIAWTSAQGLGGQRIYVVPNLELVVVITAGRYDGLDDGEMPYELFAEYVLRAVQE